MYYCSTLSTERRGPIAHSPEVSIPRQSGAMSRSNDRRMYCLIMLVVLLGAATATFVDPVTKTVKEVSADLDCIHERPILFFSDSVDNQVRAYDVDKAERLGAVLPLDPTKAPGNTTGISQPNGVLTYNGLLFVVNQNANQPENGAVLAYHLPKGIKSGELTPGDLPLTRSTPDPVNENFLQGPYLPRGIAIGGPSPTLFVADAGVDPSVGYPGRLLSFDAMLPYNYTGDASNVGNPYSFTTGSSYYGPSGVAFGPHDGLLYVSLRHFSSPADLAFGAIVRFDVSTPPGVFKDVFATNSDAGCAQYLHRPDGLAWGPDGRLYATGFALDPNAANPNDAGNTDKFLIFNTEGKCEEFIAYDTSADLVGNTGARKVPNSPTFGPKSVLYSVLAGPAPRPPGGYPQTGADGELRSYPFLAQPVEGINPLSKQYKVVIPSNNVTTPIYSVFANSNPGTFAYNCHSGNTLSVP